MIPWGLFSRVHDKFQTDSLHEKASQKQQKLVPSPQKKMVPATHVPENPLPFMNCEYQQTLCNSGGSDIIWGCCPFANAVCCSDYSTCCPNGMECATTTTAMCASNSSVMVRLVAHCRSYNIQSVWKHTHIRAYSVGCMQIFRWTHSLRRHPNRNRTSCPAPR